MNVSQVDPAKVNAYYLPGDINAELEEAFNYYDKEKMGYITMPHFYNILHNFGFHARQKKEQDEELRKND